MHLVRNGSADARPGRLEFDQPGQRDRIIRDVRMRPIGPLAELPQFTILGG